MKRSNSRVRKS